MRKRLRKKLHLKEFQELGFEIWFKMKSILNVEDHNQFWDDFIEEAIESVLNQKTSFKVELVIGEDCSLDNTKEIILKYHNQYPDIIKPLIHETNLGLTPNSVATQNACKGRYIALLDGDDYWTDPHKLAEQVQFLEEHPEYAGSGHQAQKVYQDGSSEPHNFGSEETETFGVDGVIGHRRFHTSSLVYRQKIWEKMGGIPTAISSNERAIYIIVALNGLIKYFNRSMCIYRLSSVGLSSRIQGMEKEADFEMISWIKAMNVDFPIYRFKTFLHLTTFSDNVGVSWYILIKHYILFVLFSFSYFPENLGDGKYGTIEFLKIVGLKLKRQR